MNTLKTLGFAALAACGTLVPVAAETQARGARPPAEYVAEVVTRYRVLAARQNPRFTPFRESRYSVHLDSRITDPAGGNVSYGIRYEPATYVDTARLTTRSDGSVLTAVGRARVLRGSPIAGATADSSASDNSYVERTLSLVRATRVVMPAARLWRFVPVVRAAPLRAGAAWRDTLRFASEENGFAQTLDGVRMSVVVGDTIVNNRRLWIISDSSALRITEKFREMEYSVGLETPINRSTSGFTRGRYLYDDELRLAVSRSDTTVLSGTAVLSYPDGRSFTTAVRQEERQQTRLYTGTQYAVYQEEQRAAAARARTGMLILPNAPEQERLVARDTAFRDSLLINWDTTRDADERGRLFSLLSFWGSRGDTAFSNLLYRRAVAAADTIAWLERLTNLLEVPRWDEATLRNLLLPLLADPGTAFSLGLSRDRFYEIVRGQLLDNPPAITPDSANWDFRPSIYTLFDSFWTSASEPRLKAIGLLSRFVRNPRVWSDTLIANVSLSPYVLGSTMTLVQGIGATWPAASKRPMPPQGATWRDWLEWMGGRSPDYPVPASIIARSNPRYPELRFDPSHVKAIRFFEANTGRNVTAELQQAHAAATLDSAKLVFATMLNGLGALTVDPAELERQIRSGSLEMLTLARRTLPQIFAEAMRSTRTGFAPDLTINRLPSNVVGGVRIADTVVAAQLIDRLIESLLDGSQPWSPVEARVQGIGTAPAVRPGQPAPSLTILRDSIPASVIEKWRTRVTFVTRSEMAAFNPREERRTYTLSPILQAGQFALLSFDYSERVARAANEAPAGYAGGTQYYLMLVNGEWVIVSSGGWIT